VGRQLYTLDKRAVRQPRIADREEKGRKGVWTARQCGAFLAGAADDRLFAAWALAVVCGMRRGELAGLKWSKVDLDSGVIHWRRSGRGGLWLVNRSGSWRQGSLRVTRLAVRALRPGGVAPPDIHGESPSRWGATHSTAVIAWVTCGSLAIGT
jgi:integrase